MYAYTRAICYIARTPAALISYNNVRVCVSVRTRACKSTLNLKIGENYINMGLKSDEIEVFELFLR